MNVRMVVIQNINISMMYYTSTTGVCVWRVVSCPVRRRQEMSGLLLALGQEQGLRDILFVGGRSHPRLYHCRRPAVVRLGV